MCGSYVWETEASCQSCMEKECCSELRACDTGTPCATLAACVAKCMAEDDTCLGACLTADSNQHQSSGSDAYYALSSCFGVSCQAQANCSFPVCNSGWTWSIRGCAECLSQTSCCTALTTCFSDELCSDCIAEETLQDCSGDMSYVASNTCVASTCGTVCADTICGSIDFSFASPRCNYCLSKATGGLLRRVQRVHRGPDLDLLRVHVELHGDGVRHRHALHRLQHVLRQQLHRGLLRLLLAGAAGALPQK